jgi:ABC-2 type transport system permease protein
MIEFNAVYVLWIREIKRTLRSKARIIGMLATPLLFLVFFGMGFGGMQIPGMENGTSYILFIIPGIIGMALIFSSIFAGVSVLWDREFGFLKEIMVAPVSRVSIMIGRIAGGANVSLMQGIAILLISLLIGMKLTVASFLLSMLFMALISVTFIGLGLVIASNMRDMQAFNLIVNFIIFPLFFLSGALFPLNNLPNEVKLISYLDPLTYGVDGMRAALLGSSIFPIYQDIIALLVSSAVMILLGSYFFEKEEM